jgi:hypothetical protein
MATPQYPASGRLAAAWIGGAEHDEAAGRAGIRVRRNRAFGTPARERSGFSHNPPRKRLTRVGLRLQSTHSGTVNGNSTRELCFGSGRRWPHRSSEAA